MYRDNKLDSASIDICREKLEQLKTILKTIFPEVFCEDQIDINQLKRVLGEDVISDKERFGLNWSGKAECLKSIQQPIIATLKPCREESIDFDATQNLFIEGDNLEVLKLLLRSYSNKVKMIYIDPPYNTGKDFIYPDNYNDNLGVYLNYTKQKDEENNKFATNPETNGRYHSKWLNMMYPRLYHARSLLREDGVIFISIDDHEQANLKLLCDEIFGEENLCAFFIWDKQHSQQQGLFKVYHEYIILYAKNKEQLSNICGGEGEIDAGALKKISKENPESEFTFPAGVRFEASDGKVLTGTYGDSEKVTVSKGRLACKDKQTLEQVTLSAGWTQKEQMKRYFNGEEVFDSKMQKVLEFYFNASGKLKCRKLRSKITPSTLLPKYGMVSQQTAFITQLFGTHVFDNPKPVGMIKDFISWFVSGSDLILDFFSGSSTTADAVMQLNTEDQGNRNYIMVQLPEPCHEDSEAYKAGYKTIAEIGKERIRRAAIKIRQENPDYQGDLGFKVFKLDRSNFKIWNGDCSSKEEFDHQLEFNTNHVVNNTTKENILYEIILRLGLTLTSNITILTLINKKEVFSLEEGKILICLEKIITEQLVEEMTKCNPDKVIFLDEGFQNNDQLKVNAGYNFRNHIYNDQNKEIEFITI